METWSGGRQCGAIRYEVAFEEVLTLVCCHCRECQRQSASAFGRSTYEALAHFSRPIEEFIEMLANTLLWSVFLLHFMRLAPELRMRFRSVEAS
jgi:hypothetical protein